MIPWELQQKRDKDWYKGDINKRFAMQHSRDYFSYIYDKFCKSIHGKAFNSALDIGISNTGGYLTVIPNIKNRIGLDTCVDYLRSIDMLPLAYHIKYVNGNAENMIFGKDTFDLVIITNAIDHCKDMHSVVDEIKRVLKPGGYVLFSTYLRVTKPHPHTFQTAEEARNLFKDFDVVEEREEKDWRPFDRRNDVYVAILQKK